MIVFYILVVLMVLLPLDLVALMFFNQIQTWWERRTGYK